MYAGVLGEKPQKTYFGLYQHRKQVESSPRAGKSRGSRNNGAFEGEEDEEDLGTVGSEYSRPSSVPLELGGNGRWPASTGSTSVATRQPTAFGSHPHQGRIVDEVRRSVPLMGTYPQRPSVPLLGDPRLSPRAKVFRGVQPPVGVTGGRVSTSTFPPGHANPYGAAPKDLVALQQMGLDGRSVFPDGYLTYLNRISYVGGVVDDGASTTSSTTGAARPPPPDHFANVRHRPVSEMADKFDTAGANWVNALRQAGAVPTVNVRNNNGNDPSPRRTAAMEKMQRSPPYTSRKATVKMSFQGRRGRRRSGKHHSISGGGGKPAAASHKRWVPTASRSLNGWIAGLRGDGDDASTATRGTRQRHRQRQRPWGTQQRLWDSQQRSSWLRSVQQNSHLMRQSTHSDRVHGMEEGIFDAEQARAWQDQGAAAAGDLDPTYTSRVLVRE